MAVKLMGTSYSEGPRPIPFYTFVSTLVLADYDK